MFVDLSMIIKNLDEQNIIQDKKINSLFLSVLNNKLQIKCKILKNDFYLDSFNYFPITDNNLSFRSLFRWGNADPGRYNNFYTKHFSKNFSEKRKNFKNFTNAVILGSSPSNSYFRNMMTFLPRIFFIIDKEINLVIHRNTSNKFRVFIKEILAQKKIKVKKFIYLDDDFYKFKNSQIHQFFSMAVSTIILNKSLSYTKMDSRLKIYLSRNNSVYRNLINEGDLIEKLKLKNFLIVDTKNMSIFEQIKLFSKADVIVGPTSSALTNIVFCKKGAHIIEIIPKYKYDYENTFKGRYSKIGKYLKLNYMSIEADPVNNVKLNANTNEFISKKILRESNYYKDLLIGVKKFEKIISEF